MIIALLAAPDAAAAQTTAGDYCPPDGSSVAILTRQAFDEGRATVGREYGKFIGELSQIAISAVAENEVVERSIDVSKRLAAAMGNLGHDVTVGEIVVHWEAELIFQIRVARQPITKARYTLQLAVAQEMKRVLCNR
ncbi:MAG: hypothetical protein K2Z80_23990 [Xanthobacteraceae bacterium]|nr:hypothetical protein [Xanthobacteraceae bacterium]